MPRWAMTRVGAVQIWPEWKPQTDAMPVMAVLRSASSKTMHAPLPPSSISSRFMSRPATSPIRCPTAVDPVKLIMSTSGEATSASAGAGPSLTTTLTTPGGRPAARAHSAMTRASRGLSTGDFRITVHPAARAAAILCAKMLKVAFHGAMRAATPTGSRRTRA